MKSGNQILVPAFFISKGKKMIYTSVLNEM